MGASRTLLRGMTKRYIQFPDGKMVTVDRMPRPKPPRKRPGCHLIPISYIAGVERELHPTKGYRTRSTGQ